MQSTVPISDTYLDIEKLIYHMCWEFQRMYGGNFEDMVSEANYAFMRAYATFDPSNGCPFHNYLAICIKRRLVDLKRDEGRRMAWSLDKFESETNQTYGSQVEWKDKKEFELDAYTNEMSEDAASVVRLALESPEEIETTSQKKGDQPRNWRSTIRNYLRELGWTTSRIAASFEEIRIVLR